MPGKEKAVSPEKAGTLGETASKSQSHYSPSALKNQHLTAGIAFFSNVQPWANLGAVAALVEVSL